ncbi:MAG: cation diffusion facilitator family transporter [Oscillospiraceae bacterium]|nr:cation diffusion facilitator family transporter [Oscillospiraceae bacterium]
MKKSENNTVTEEIAIRKMSAVSLIGNTVLSAFKLAAGALGNSPAMISDAVHSMSDVFSTFIAMIGVKLAARKADKDHPYGHDRFECVASIILCGILLAAGVGIGWGGINTIIGGNYDSIEVPGMVALIAAIVSVLTKEWMFHYTKHYAQMIGSSAFMADAWHHRSDALSSVGALIGIGGAMLGFPVMEPIAEVVICIFIVKAAVDIFRDALSKMLDTSCSSEYESQLTDFVASQPGVVRVDLIRTRKFGSKVYIDAEIAVNGDISLRDAHEIAENVHSAVEESFSDIKHIMIHVNPADDNAVDNNAVHTAS